MLCGHRPSAIRLGDGDGVAGKNMYKVETRKFYVYSEGYRKPSAITALDREEAEVFSRWLNRNRPGARYRATPFRGNVWKHFWMPRQLLIELMIVTAVREDR